MADYTFNCKVRVPTVYMITANSVEEALDQLVNQTTRATLVAAAPDVELSEVYVYGSPEVS